MDDWNRFHDQYGPLVWETVYRILANHSDALDCCQEVFAELFRKSAAEAVRDWPAYLRWLATRRAFNRLKQRRIESSRMDSAENLTTVHDAAIGPSGEAEWHELLSNLRVEIARLPEQQSQAFWLNAIEQMSYAEVAEQLGIDSNNVGVLIHRARQRLRQSMGVFNPLNQ